MNNKKCVEYSYVDMDTLTPREIATWNMKDVASENHLSTMPTKPMSSVKRVVENITADI